MHGKRGIKKEAPVRKAYLNPRDCPMYGQKDGVTMGGHLDEFKHFRDNRGRTFDQLVYSILHDETIAPTSPPQKSQTGSVGSQKNKIIMSQRLKLDAKKTITAQKKGVDFDTSQKLQNSYLSDACKRMIPVPERKRKRVEKGNEVKDEDEGEQDPERRTASLDKFIEVERKRKRLGVRRML
jgi:hypothetical protein